MSLPNFVQIGSTPHVGIQAPLKPTKKLRLIVSNASEYRWCVMRSCRRASFENPFPVKTKIGDNGSKCKITSVFDRTRINAAAVSKWSEICEI